MEMPKPNVLLVDDDDETLQLYERFLDNPDWTLIKARSGMEALQLAETTDFSAIVLDVCMPGMDGLEAARRLRSAERTRTVPIVFASAVDRTGMHDLKAYDAGAVDFLFKPVEPAVLRAKVRVLVELSQKTAEVKLQGEMLREAERREHERQLSYQKQLLEMNKQKAVGILAAGVAHHFNNILQIALGHAELAQRYLPPGSPAAAPLTTVSKAGRRAVELVRRMLVLGKPQPDDEEMTPLNHAVLETVRVLKPTLPTSITVATNLGTGAGSVKMQFADLEQILVVLAMNARDAMLDGGVLTIETGAMADPPTDRLPPSGETPLTTRLTVRDTGSGMDAATRAHLFEPFFTTKQPDRGVGLGLYTAYTLIERHGGSIQVESEPGRGSSFHVQLPRFATAPVRPIVEPGAVRTAGSVPAPQATVLVVEDEDEVRTLLEQVLLSGGYEVFTAASAEEALLEFTERLDRIDLLLADVVLPGMSGLSLARRFQEARPDLKVLHVTAHSDVIKERRFSAGKFVKVLAKPFEIDELLKAVEESITNVVAG
ncbi:MAG: response regulator [Candidatus Riflebacteria bacterium]|nr:response regulator [Candidatus Riflebacteria bacterium]